MGDRSEFSCEEKIAPVPPVLGEHAPQLAPAGVQHEEGRLAVRVLADRGGPFVPVH